jgi:hypothetical protein
MVSTRRRKRQARASAFPPLPKELTFPIYGLASTFTGTRNLGFWDDMDDGGQPDRESQPVWRVELLHLSEPDVLVTVHTIAKILSFGSVGPRGFADAISHALFHLIQIATVDPPGEARGKYIVEKMAEWRRLESDLGSEEWGRTTLTVEGVEREALLHRIGHGWAAAVDLDHTVALGLAGRGAEPGDYELVAIDDLAAYPARW